MRRMIDNKFLDMVLQQLVNQSSELAHKKHDPFKFLT